MDYAQARIATLHDLADHTPSAPTDRATVVVPLAERESASPAAERTFAALQTVDVNRVVVPLRSGADRVDAVREWLAGFDLPIELLWCDGEHVEDLLEAAGLDGDGGKGRDVWLALGVAAQTGEFVVCHDADRRTYSAADVPRLLAPLADGFEFSKGYYARVEDGRLFGRLWRLLFVPLVRALIDQHEAPILTYLDAFRYALAGEFGLTADLARQVAVERRFGLEVSTLGGAFDQAGFDGTVQVDLGRYEHDHRAVSGPTGLADMATDVTPALFRVVQSRGVSPDFETLPGRYRESAEGLIAQYAADARHNGLDFDRGDERDQVARYAESVVPPGPDDRLPPWSDANLTPAEVREAAAADIDER